jgi:anti-anti-sigma regulatory factor
MAAPAEDRVIAQRLPGSVSVIAAQGKIDKAKVAEIAQRIRSALADGPRLVVIDLLGARLSEPENLSAFYRSLRDLRASAQLSLVGLDRRAQWVLELCDIEGVEAHSTITAAVASSEIERSRRHLRWWRIARARLRGIPGPRGAARRQASR